MRGVAAERQEAIQAAVQDFRAQHEAELKEIYQSFEVEKRTIMDKLQDDVQVRVKMATAEVMMLAADDVLPSSSKLFAWHSCPGACACSR